ncbi:MAG: hypothetical protein ACYCYK_11535, partial [Candidatus Dormibacteria bacterium]
MSPEALAVGALAAVAIFLVVVGVGIRRTPQVDLLDARLAVYDAPDDNTKTMQELELSQPFGDRFIKPFLDRLGRRVASLQPKGQAQKLQIMIDLAGRPLGLTASSLIAAQIVLAVALGLAGLGLTALLGLPVLLGLVFGVVAG